MSVTHREDSVKAAQEAGQTDVAELKKELDATKAELEKLQAAIERGLTA